MKKLMLALMLLLLLTVGCTNGQHSATSNRAGGPKNRIFVATVDIPAGTSLDTITQQHMVEITFSESPVAPQSVQDHPQIEGMKTTAAIPKGTRLLTTMFVASG